MRKNLLIALLIFLFIGGCDLNCGKGPTTYWKVENFSISNEKVVDGNRLFDIEESTYDNLQIRVNFDLNKVASIDFKMNNLYALDCSDPKIMRNEISSIEVLTIYDLNDEYLAGANINEIVTLNGLDVNQIAQTDLSKEFSFYGWAELKVEERILSDREFSLDITIELSDGKVLNKISRPIRII